MLGPISSPARLFQWYLFEGSVLQLKKTITFYLKKIEPFSDISLIIKICKPGYPLKVGESFELNFECDSKSNFRPADHLKQYHGSIIRNSLNESRLLVKHFLINSDKIFDIL